MTTIGHETRVRTVTIRAEFDETRSVLECVEQIGANLRDIVESCDPIGERITLFDEEGTPLGVMTIEVKP